RSGAACRLEHSPVDRQPGPDRRSGGRGLGTKRSEWAGAFRTLASSHWRPLVAGAAATGFGEPGSARSIIARALASGCGPFATRPARAVCDGKGTPGCPETERHG